MYKIILIIIHCLFSGAFLRPQARINSFITVGFLCTYISLQFCYLGLVEIICRLRYNIVAPCTCISPILYLSLSYVGTISQPKIPVSRACLYFLISLFYLIVTRQVIKIRQIWPDLDLKKGRSRFLHFSEAPLILYKNINSQR